jgi:RND family efflux transporter MFP subunit
MRKLLSVYLFIFALVLLSCNPEIDEKIITVSSDTNKDQILTVRTEEVKLSTFNYLIQSTGKIKSLKEQKIISKANGSIEFSSVHNNSIVNEGETLLKLDSKAVQIDLQLAKESLFNSTMNYKSDLLSQEGLISDKKSSLKDTIYRKLRANSGLGDSELQIKKLQLELTKSIIKAPFSGTVANVKVQRGNYVKEGEELFTLYSHSDLYLEAKILESDISSIKLGQRAEIFPIASQVKHTAIVEEINPLIDENGMVLIKLLINYNKDLLPGMNATAIISAPQKKALIVPKTAVVMRENKTIVFTYEKGLAKWNYVIVGRDNGKEIEIRDGLKPGEKVITTNNLQLAHDSPVNDEK